MSCTNLEAQKVHHTYVDELDAEHGVDQNLFELFELDARTLPVDINLRRNGPTSDISSLAPPNPPLSSLAASFTGSSVSLPSVPQRSAPNTQRRELVWKSQNPKTRSLEEIAHHFQDFLLASSTEVVAFNRRRGRYTTQTAHRCPGYKRIEITLTSDIARSAIVSHLTPIPHEICPVCKETVKDAEIFACICGEDGEASHVQNSLLVWTDFFTRS
jgi:hypothetical protein